MTREKEKAAARVAQEIVQTIYDEGLLPGDRYLSEADALTRHGVSRATLREALRFLEFQGVLQVRAGPGGGAVVRRPGWPHLTSTFALLLQFADAPLAAVMAARTALEPAMAELAVKHATASQLAEMQRSLDEAREALGDAEIFFPAYRSFWATLADCTGNAVTAMLWPALRALIDSGGFVPHERNRLSLLDRMSALLETVRARDVAEAQRLVREHDLYATDRLERNYPHQISRRVAWSDASRIQVP